MTIKPARKPSAAPVRKSCVLDLLVSSTGRVYSIRDEPENFDLRPPGKKFMAAYAEYITHKNTVLGSAGQLESVRSSLG